MVTEAGLITDSGHALGTDGVEISLVQGEIGAAEVARNALALTRSAAGRAPNHGGIMGLGLVNFQDGTTEAAESRSRRQVAGVVLFLAIGTSYQKSHGQKNGAIGAPSQLDLSQTDLQPSPTVVRLIRCRRGAGGWGELTETNRFAGSY